MSSIAESARREIAVGGKAGQLLELRSAGFNVPEFIVSPVNLEQASQELGWPLAVRSSASVEDGKELSFPGLFKSYLNLTTFAEVRSAVAACHASRDSEVVTKYCIRHGKSPAEIRIDFILQRMVNSELAGVAFSIDPATGREEVRIEACLGTGERLLAGEVDPLPPNHPLLARYRTEIEALVGDLQQYFGTPQDVEFAIADGTLFLLQSRPITRIAMESGVGEWTTAIFRDGGVSNRVCSPLMWSLYRVVWSDALTGFLREIRLLKGDFEAARLFFGRPYWNLGAVKDCLLRLPGFSERDFVVDLCLPFSDDKVARCGSRSLWNLLRSAPALYAIANRIRRQPGEAATLLRDESGKFWSKYEAPQESTLKSFQQLIDVDYRKIETTYFRTIFTTVLAKMDLMTWFPQIDFGRLMSALPAPRYVSQFRELRQSKLAGNDGGALCFRRIAHHSPHGLDVCLPRWDEEIQLIRDLLEQPIGHSPENPSPAYTRARSAILASLKPWRRTAFSKKLDRLRHLVWLREELRDLSDQVYYWIRRFALRIAEERQLGEDIFMMTYPEIVHDDRRHLAHHRKSYKAYFHFPAPAELGSPAAPALASNANTFRGLGVSPGTATGRAWIATSLHEALRIEANSILVCRFIEPSWVPVLDRVAAIITESGGALSHAAVIAREYGIPAVLGVSAATRKVQAGDRLCVQGDRGLITRVDST